MSDTSVRSSLTRLTSWNGVDYISKMRPAGLDLDKDLLLIVWAAPVYK